MRLHQEELETRTQPKRFVDLTPQIVGVVTRSGIQAGLVTVFVRHTSASLVIQENADPAVLRDLERWMSRVVPEGGGYEHDDEGPDDMPAHIRSMLTRSSESIPVTAGRLSLGTWQALYLWEHRSQPHQRRVLVQVIGA